MNITNKQKKIENRVLKVSQIDINEDDKIVKDYIIVEPVSIKDDYSKVAGITVLVTYKERAYAILTKRPGYPNNQKEYIELPRGFIDNGESQEEAARREAQEELGYKLDILNTEVVYSLSPEPGVIGGLNSIVWVNLRKPIDTDKNRDYISNDVDLGISKSITIDINAKTLKSLIDQRKILDVMSIVGLQYAVMNLKDESRQEACA